MPRRLREYKLLLRSAYDSIVAAIDDAMERIARMFLHLFAWKKQL